MSDQLLINATSSVVAGIIGRIFTHPLDTAKARLQAETVTRPISAVTLGTPPSAHLQYRGPWDVLVQTARYEGIAGWYRGFTTVLVGGTPGTVLYLCSYDLAKDHLTKTFGWKDANFLVHFSSGMIAETIACIVYVPVDVIKERMQVQQGGMASSAAPHNFAGYRNGWDALKQILRTEGVRGIYRGYGATLASFGPFSALYFMFYEKFKEWGRLQQAGWFGTMDRSTKELDEAELDLSFPRIVLCSASAGALASWLTSPLDMAKLRLQIQRGAAATATEGSGLTQGYRGIIDCLRHSWEQGGWRGLFRGAGARVFHFAPATTITMTSYEMCRSMITKLPER